jgi:hypothetical protein
MSCLRPVSGGKCALAAAALLGALSAAGCDDDVGKRYSVTGRVLFNGEPLQGKTGAVVFKPDPLRGNKCTVEAIGTIDTEGNFTLFTKSKAGAPLGQYTVIVTASEPGQAQANNRVATGRNRKAPPPLIPARYAHEATSGLTKEVVADPPAGAYDLNLTK